MARAPMLKDVAARVGLSPSTVSMVLNQAPVARTIPQATQERILRAARELDYRPHFLARSLRTQRTQTIGVLVSEIAGGYTSEVLGGIEDRLQAAGYFYILASHRHRSADVPRYVSLLVDRRVDGLIIVDTELGEAPPMPTAAVSGGPHPGGVAAVILDHRKAAELALGHIRALGHRRLAVIRGQSWSVDSGHRWRATQAVARRLGITIPRRAVAALDDDPRQSEVQSGLQAARAIVAARQSFTALFAFNDFAAIGAMRALEEAGLRVPQDVSVIGFDDIDAAGFNRPALTTVRQPMRQMGVLAADAILRRLDGGEPLPPTIVVGAELVVRQSTGPAPDAARR